MTAETMIGYTVTGIAGASAAAEFKIGFDQESKRFQIKMKAQAAWGLGVGGSFSFTVGLNDLYDFACLVYEQLLKQDFCFVDMFEGEGDESRVDVFGLFNAMCTHLLLKGHPLLAIGVSVAINKKTLSFAAEFLENGIDNAREWKFKKQKNDNLDILSNTILKEPDFIKRLPPETKGRILYLLCTAEQGYMEKLGDMWDGDINELHEDAAKTLIVNGIVSKRDWQETLEHMAEKDSNVPYVSQQNKQTRGNLTPEEMKEKSQRAEQNLKRLKNGLFKNEPEKWGVIKAHIYSLN